MIPIALRLLSPVRVILVGDHKQLPPVVISKTAADRGLVRSLFERFISNGNPFVRLTVQYRMHPAISRFSSDQFYDGKIVNGVSANERTSEFKFPKCDVPFFFLDTAGEELSGTGGVSYSNAKEAFSVKEVILMLLRKGISAS